MLGRTVLGLDLGSYSLKAAELRAGFRGVEFRRLEEMLLPQSASAEEREAALARFLDPRGLPREFVVTALPAARGTQRHLRLPFAGAARVEGALAFEIEEELPLALDRVVMAHEQVSAGPDQTRVLAVLVPGPEVENHLAALRRVQAEPRIIEIEGGALANLSSYLTWAGAPRLLLDVGHQKTTLCLLVEGKPVLLRSIACAGEHFTQAIAHDLRLPYEDAEEHKHEAGIFEPGGTRPRTPALRAALDHLARETLRSVQAVVGDPLQPIAPVEIVLTGGSARLERLTHYLSERTGLPGSVLEVPPQVEGGAALAHAGAAGFAHAAALALRGSSTERVTQIDLRQEQFRYTPDLSGLRGQLRLTLGLFGVLLALWVASLATQLWSAEGRADALRSRIGSVYRETFPEAELPADAPGAMEARLLESRELANHLGLTGSGLSILEVLRHISSRIPPALDVSLRELRLERHSARARGYSNDFVSVDRVKEELARVDFFDEVVLSDVVNEPRRGGKSFSLTIKFRENGE